MMIENISDEDEPYTCGAYAVKRIKEAK